MKMISARMYIYKGMEMKRQNAKGHTHALNGLKSWEKEIRGPGTWTRIQDNKILGGLMIKEKNVN
jgi:hypothetical protein